MNMPQTLDPVRISVAIPSWNSIDLTRNCVRSLVDADHGCEVEVVVVDNGSQDGSAEMIETEFPSVKLIRNAVNEYFSKASNQAAAGGSGRYVCLLNSDTIVPPGSLLRMVEFLRDHADYGAVAPQLAYEDGTVQAICRRFPRLFEVVVDQFDLSFWGYARRYRDWAAMKDFDHLSSMDVEQPPGACLVMHASEFKDMGGFDEGLPLFYSDVDLCLRLHNSGRRIRFLAEARVFHVGSASIVRHPLWRSAFIRDQIRYFRKHKGRAGAFIATCVILLSAGLTALRTVLGRRSVAEKRQLLAQIGRSTRAAVWP